MFWLSLDFDIDEEYRVRVLEKIVSSELIVLLLRNARKNYACLLSYFIV